MTGEAALEAVIEARCLRKSFATAEVVRGIDIAVPRAHCFGLLGPNGAGKTTIIRMLLGQSPLTSGSLEVFGQPMPAAGRSVRGRMGVVPQIDNLDPDFTVAENLRVYGSYFGLEANVIAARIQNLLEFVALSDRAESRIDTLSGGMKRRLTIARALINDPELLVLDEPTTGLDPQARHMIWARLRDLRQSGKTLVLTTHYMEEAERLCDEVVIIDQGRILAQGSPPALIRQYVEPEVLELRGDKADIGSLFDDVPGSRVETIGDTVYCYMHDAKSVDQLLQRAPKLSFLRRPANLEDVFLAITGRELRD
jgi:lipooligosaccharide transport system ATP-binding protein